VRSKTQQQDGSPGASSAHDSSQKKEAELHLDDDQAAILGQFEVETPKLADGFECKREKDIVCLILIKSGSLNLEGCNLSMESIDENVLQDPNQKHG